MRRTKIVCTIGPATDSLQRIEALVRAGMNVARLNFSHGTVEEHQQRIEWIREAEERSGKPIGILLDIQGPKIRLGHIEGQIDVMDDDIVHVFSGDRDDALASDVQVLPIMYEPLIDELKPGHTIYLNDGHVELKVEGVLDDRAVCRVISGGSLVSRKGVSLPQVAVDLPAMDEADADHIRFGVQHGVDFVAASFVRKPEHVEEVLACIREAGGHQHVIAKIESREGVQNIRAILEVADGIMVARGDLGVELPSEEVPLVQKALIRDGNLVGKPVITATQMLDSMERNPRPTRAEVTDVANAILDGTDAVMLSGETAVGLYPIETVSMMDRIARKTEEQLDYAKLLDLRRKSKRTTVADAIAHATCETAADLSVKAIMCSTQSGATARMVSKYRPRAPIFAVTPYKEVVTRLSLVWGVRAFCVPHTTQIDDMIDQSIRVTKEIGLVSKGDLLAIVAGVLTGTPGSTNLLQIHVAGEERIRIKG